MGLNQVIVEAREEEENH